MAPTLGVVIPVGGSHARYVWDALNSLFLPGGDGDVDAPEQVVVVYDRIEREDVPGVLSLSTTQERYGASAARNIGLEALRTDYVFYLDADDMMMPGGVGLLRAAMVAGYNFIHSRRIFITRGDKWSTMLVYDTVPEVRRKVRERDGRPNVGVSVCVKRARALEIGGHDEALTFGEDNDFAIRYVMPEWVTYHMFEVPLVHARNETSTRWEGVTVADDGPFQERLRSGYYLQ